jgi:hypothetical protein
MCANYHSAQTPKQRYYVAQDLEQKNLRTSMLAWMESIFSTWSSNSLESILQGSEEGNEDESEIGSVEAVDEE